jgi:hypothetical protein
MQEAFEAERKERLEREGRILKQLGEHEQEVALRFEQERVRHHEGQKARRVLWMCGWVAWRGGGCVSTHRLSG